MISSLEDAMPFFIKWRDASLPIDVVFAGKGVGFFAVARVSERTDETLLELVNESNDFLLRLPLRGCRFNFVTPKDASAELQMELDKRGLEFAWEITLREGCTVSLYEVRRVESE